MINLPSQFADYALKAIFWIRVLFSVYLAPKIAQAVLIQLLVLYVKNHFSWISQPTRLAAKNAQIQIAVAAIHLISASDVKIQTM